MDPLFRFIKSKPSETSTEVIEHTSKIILREEMIPSYIRDDWDYCYPFILPGQRNMYSGQPSKKRKSDEISGGLSPSSSQCSKKRKIMESSIIERKFKEAVFDDKKEASVID